MIYDSPLWASDGWVIPEVASFKEEGLVTPEEWEGEKGKLKICCSKVVTAIFSPTSVSRDRESRPFFWWDFTRPWNQDLCISICQLVRDIKKAKPPILQFTILSASKCFLKSLKFIYTEKATKFCEIFPLLLTVCTEIKSKGTILHNFVAFSEYMNFKIKKARLKMSLK